MMPRLFQNTSTQANHSDSLDELPPIDQMPRLSRELPAVDHPLYRSYQIVSSEIGNRFDAAEINEEQRSAAQAVLRAFYVRNNHLGPDNFVSEARQCVQNAINELTPQVLTGRMWASY